MTEARMVRSAEQSELIKKLADEVREWAEATSYYELVIVQCIIDLLDAVRQDEFGEGGTMTCEPVRGVLHKIRVFARVPSERLYLAHMLFEELAKTFGAWAQTAYQRDQRERPEEVFHAPSAMSEIND